MAPRLPPGKNVSKASSPLRLVRHIRGALPANSQALPDACRDAQIMPPVFQIVSDRRGKTANLADGIELNSRKLCRSGGRTAWSSRVTVHGRTLSARFWYDGKNLNNAKEDAAEMAYNYLSGSAPSSPSNSRGSW